MLKQRGYTLIEVLVSLALLGIISAALFLGIGTAIKITSIMGNHQRAENLAQLQMEWIKQQDGLLSEYGIVPEADSFNGYYISTQIAYVGIPPVNARDDRIQKISVTVTFFGREVMLEGYKSQ